MEVVPEMVVAVVGVVDMGIVEVVGEAQVQEGRPCFLDLLLPHLKLDPRHTINDLYNMCVNQ